MVGCSEPDCREAEASCWRISVAICVVEEGERTVGLGDLLPPLHPSGTGDEAADWWCIRLCIGVECDFGAPTSLLGAGVMRTGVATNCCCSPSGEVRENT